MRRLALTRADQGSGDSQGLTPIAVYHLLQEEERWTIRYDNARKGTWRSEIEEQPVLWVDGKRPRMVRPLGDIGSFNQVALSVIGLTKNKDVALRFSKDGETLLTTGRKRFGEPGLETVLFDLPLQTGAPDQIELDFTSGWRTGVPMVVGVESVAFLRKPLIDWLPDPADGPRLVAVGQEGRRAVGLAKSRPLRLEFTPRAGEELRLSYGIPAITSSGDQTTSFSLQLVSESARLNRVIEVSDEGRPRWHMLTLDLGDFADQSTVLDITVTGDGESAVAIGEPTVSIPNEDPASVLLVTSDTHRADHVGAAPDSIGVDTPFLDRLASEGVYFLDCRSPTNITLPAHVSLFTGVSPRDTGIVNNISNLAPEATTLAEHFQSAGYETLAAISITHLSFDTSGPGQGFDRMNVASGALDSSRTLSIAEDWLRESATRPVFMWIHVFDAHAPYLPPEDYRRLYYPEDRDPFDKSLDRPGQKIIPSWLKGLRDLEYPKALYRSEVTYLDEQLGRFYGGSRFEKGLVVVTADHGESFGAHNIWFEHKGLFPNTLSIPLILKGPGIPAQVRSSSPVTLLDVGRTLLDASGLAHVVHPGRNLLALHESPSREPRFAISGHASDASVTVGPWHLVLHLARPMPFMYDTRHEQHQVQLYQLDRDPACEDDLVEREPERARRLREILVDWLMAARPAGWNLVNEGALDADEIEALAGLGYATGTRTTNSNDWFDPECECDFCEAFR